MFEKFLRFSAAFDWITPTWTLIVSHRRRPHVTYAIPVNYYGGPAGIRRLMQSWGAEVWGADIYDDETIIHARERQAQYIEIKLEEYGIPYRGGLGVKKSASKPEVSEKVSGDLIDRLLGGIDKLSERLG